MPSMNFERNEYTRIMLALNDLFLSAISPKNGGVNGLRDDQENPVYSEIYLPLLTAQNRYFIALDLGGRPNHLSFRQWVKSYADYPNLVHLCRWGYPIKQAERLSGYFHTINALFAVLSRAPFGSTDPAISDAAQSLVPNHAARTWKKLTEDLIGEIESDSVLSFPELLSGRLKTAAVEKTASLKRMEKVVANFMGVLREIEAHGYHVNHAAFEVVLNDIVEATRKMLALVGADKT